jgi:hypothetical protein
MFLFSMEMVEENEMVAGGEREWTEVGEGATVEPRQNIKVIYFICILYDCNVN